MHSARRAVATEDDERRECDDTIESAQRRRGSLFVRSAAEQELMSCSVPLAHPLELSLRASLVARGFEAEGDDG